MLEAKNGVSLSALGKAAGFRQGSLGYIGNALGKYKAVGGSKMNLANEMRTQLRAGSLESFDSLRRGNQLSQFNLSQFSGASSQNLRSNTFFINRNIGR